MGHEAHSAARVPRPTDGRARRAWLALLPLVLTAHLWLADALVAPQQLGFGAGEAPAARIEVAFVRELQPEAAPAVPPPVLRRLRSAPRAPDPAASAAATDADATTGAAEAALARTAIEPAPAVPAPEIAPPPAADALPALAALAEPHAAAASVALAPSAASPASAAAARFDWPPSTRLSYLLNGNYQGPVQGQASVEWRAVGTRYQVDLEVSIGPPFAPLVTRRLSSDGRISEDGLAPRRYDEETRAVLREPRRLTIHLDERELRLPGGATVERPPGVQDSASQFVQLTWLFTLRPELLRAGTAIELPLALPRRVDRWVYEVVGPEALATPLGLLDAVHVRPRRNSRRGPDLTAEFWVAPSLQNLPVRIVIRQGDENFVDLVLDRLPQQATR